MQSTQRFGRRCLSFLFIVSLLIQTLPPPTAQAISAATRIESGQRTARTAPVRAASSVFFADLNGDQRVDDNDLAAIGQAWNCAQDDACYSADFDFDSNGVIDAVDLAAVGNEFDVEPPAVAITAPAADAVVSGATLRVEGTVGDRHGVPQVLVNGVVATQTGGNFHADIPISDGPLAIHAAATDALGMTNSAGILVQVDNEGPFLTVVSPPNRQAVNSTKPTISVSFFDLASAVQPGSLQATLTDGNGTVTNITNRLQVTGNIASGTPAADLHQDQSYTLTVTMQDGAGNTGRVISNFYVPVNPGDIAAPSQSATSGWVSGVVYNAATCGGDIEFDPVGCAGIAGAQVTLEKVETALLQQVRALRRQALAQARSPYGLPHFADPRAKSAFSAVPGTVVTGPDGFFAFPVDETGTYALRVEKEGFTYGQRMAQIVLERSTPTNDIFLTPLDAASTICNADGCQHTSADGQMEVIVPAEAIPAGQTLEIRVTEFDQVNFLPSGELPQGTAETYAFNLSGASEFVFAQPVTVRLKNSRSFPPGDVIPLGYWNQSLLQWEDAGVATVSGDGIWLEMQVTHFSNFDPNQPGALSQSVPSVKESTGSESEKCATSDCTSSLGVQGGVLGQTVDLPTVDVLDEPFGLTLSYDSGRANPSEVIDIEIGMERLDPGTELTDFVQVELFIEGEKTEQFTFPLDPAVQSGDEIGRFRLLWDGRDSQGRKLPPGVYRYAAKVRLNFRAQFFRSPFFGAPPDFSQPTGVFRNLSTDTFLFGSVLLKGDADNFLGAGWYLEGQQRLYDAQNGDILIIDGQNVATQYLFAGGNLLDNPATARAVNPLSGIHARPGVRSLQHNLPVGGEWWEASVKSEQVSVVSDDDAATAELGPLGLAEKELQVAEDAPEQTVTLHLPVISAAQSPVPDAPNLSAVATNVTADITNDTTFDLAGSPYRLLNDITIAPGVVLTVETGVVVQGVGTSTTSPALFVEGDLRADGAIFTGDSDPNVGFGWGGLVIRNGGRADLNDTQVKFGGRATVSADREAAIGVIDSTLVMTDSAIFDSVNFDAVMEGCLYVENSSVRLTNVAMDQCGSATPSIAQAALVLVGGQTIFNASGVTIQNTVGYPAAVQHRFLGDLGGVSFPGNSKQRIFLLASPFETNQTISPINEIGVFDFNSDRTIGVGTTVTLTAGVQMQAINQSDDWIVEGRLVTRGTAENPVVFTTDDANPTSGAKWGGLFVHNGGVADLEQTTISFGGQMRLANGQGAVLAVQNGSLRLVDSLLDRNQDTDTREDSYLYLENSPALIDGTIFTDQGRNDANPAFGVTVVDTAGADSFSLSNSTIAHRAAPIRLPLVHLPGLSANNSLSNTNNQRVDLTSTALAQNLTVAPIGGLGRFHYDTDITVPAGVTMTVQAGVSLRGKSNASDLIVEGSLISRGTLTNPVIFTSQADGGALNSGGEWGGVLVDGGSADLEFTTLRFGGNRRVGEENATIAVVNGNLRLINSTLFRNGDRDPRLDSYIYLEDSTALIDGSVLTDDGLNGANPAFGISVVESAARAITASALTLRNSEIVHPRRPLRLAHAHLAGVADTVRFDTQFDQRIVLTDQAFDSPTTLGPVGNLAAYEIETDLTVRGDLTMSPGTALFSAGDSLIVDGGSLHAIGAADAPIRFGGLLIGGVRQWDGIVLRNGGSAELNHAAISDAVRGVHSNGGSLSVRNSRFTGNVVGVRVDGVVPGFFARFNEFSGNSSAGLENGSPTTIDARLNFWGSINGPIHPNNPGGDGDRINGGVRVIFQPFLSAPATSSGDGGAENRTAHDNTFLTFDNASRVFTRHYPDGRIVRFRPDGRHDFTEDPSGNRLRYTYNADGSTARVEFVAAGRPGADWVWNFGYSGLEIRDLSGRTIANLQSLISRGKAAEAHTITLTDPAGRATTLTVDDLGRLVALQEPGLDAAMTFSYDAQGNMTHKQDARGFVTRYEYDDFGRIQRALLPLREIFDPVTGQFRQEQEIHTLATGESLGLLNGADPGDPIAPTAPLISSDQLVSEYTFGTHRFSVRTNEFGALTGMTDALGRTSGFDRDGRDRLTQETTPMGNCVLYAYDENDNLLNETRMDSVACGGDLAAGLVQTTTFTYEPRFNRLKSVTDPLGRTTTHFYDYEEGSGEAGLNVRTVYPPVQDEDGQTVTPEERYVYNAQGQMTELIDRRGNKHCFVYTTGGGSEAGTIFAPGVTPSPGLLTRLVEDCGGPLERTTTFRQFDATGNAQVIEEPFGAARSQLAIRNSQFRFDARGRLTETTDPLGRITRIRYDNGDNRVEVVIDATGRPLTTTTTFDPIGQPLSQVRAAQGERIEERFGYNLNRQMTLSQDGRGNRTRYHYDLAGQLVQITDAVGNESRFEYDDDGRLIQTINPRGTITTYGYDGLNRLLEEIADAGGLNLATRYRYDLNNNLLEVTDANSVRLCLEYDAWDRVVQTIADCGGLDATRQIRYTLNDLTTAEIDPLGRITRFTFDSLDRSTAMIDALGQTFTTVFDVAGLVVAETDMRGHTTTYNYDQGYRQTAVIDALGQTTHYSYDSRDNLVQVTDKLGRISRMDYDALDRLIASTDPTGAVTRFRYDAEGNLIAQTDGLGRSQHVEYDALDRPSRQIDALGNLSTLTYDANSNLIRVEDALGNSAQNSYDALDRLATLTDQKGRVTRFAYDGVGNQTSLTDPLNRAMQIDYDPLNRRVQVTDKAGGVTRFVYDLAGNLIELTDPAGNRSTFAYDALDRLLGQTNALGATRAFTYDAAGNQISVTDRNGRVRRFTYDALNRRTGETWENGNYTASYTFDAAGQMIGATDPFAAYAFTYDGMGRVTGRDESLTPARSDVDFAYSYDAVGNLLRMVESINGEAGAITDYGYDPLNRQNRITQQGADVAAKRADLSYDPLSRLTAITRFDAVGGGQPIVTSEYSYDEASLLTRIRHSAGPNTRTYDYTYDAANRLTRLVSPDGTSNYSYDDFDQLTGAAHSFQANESYSYDANGNRTGGDHQTGPENRLLDDGVFRYEYDGEGNRTRRIHNASGAVTEYTWDFRNRLTAVVARDADGAVISSVAHTYNLFNERILRTEGEGVQQFAVSNGRVQLMLDENGQTTNRYLHGPLVDLILVDEQPGAGILYPLADHQMTARDLVNTNGEIINHRLFDSFGRLVSQSNPAAYLFGYTGREMDATTGLHYYRSRHYDAATGRFLSEDGLGYLAGDTNLTRYAGNQASLRTDPFGYTSDLPDFIQINKVPASNTPISSAQMSESFFGDFVPKSHTPTAEDAARAAEAVDNLINGPADFRPGSVLENTNVIKVFQELPTDAQLAAQLAEARKIAAANKEKILDTVLTNRFASLGGSRLGNLLGIGGALIDYVDAAGNAVAEMYIAQARIMAHERVEAHRREMERRQMEIHNERMRKKNEEIRKQIKQMQEEERARHEAEQALQQSQDDLIRQQALREQKFLEEQRNRRRNRGNSQPGGFNVNQFAQQQAEEEGQKAPVTKRPGEKEIPPSNPNGLVGFLDYLAKKHGVDMSNQPGDVKGGQQPDPCFPNEGKKK